MATKIYFTDDKYASGVVKVFITDDKYASGVVKVFPVTDKYASGVIKAYITTDKYASGVMKVFISNSYTSDLDNKILDLLKKGEIEQSAGHKRNESEMDFFEKAVALKCDESDLDLFESNMYVVQLAQKNGLSQSTVDRLLKKDHIELVQEADSIMKNEGCFIATACYGNYESVEVLEFRKFRDRILAKSFWGRKFISVYYVVSPPMASLINKSEISKRIVRDFFLSPLRKLIRSQIQDE